MSLPDPRQIIGYLAPAFLAASMTLPAYRATIPRITLLSAVAVGLETAGLGMIYLLILNFTGGDPVAAVDLPLLGSLPASPMLLTAICVVLLSSGIGLKYRVISGTATVFYRAGEHAAQLAMNHARKLVPASPLAAGRQRPLRSLVMTLIKDLPFACGFAAGGLSLTVVHLIQIAVILAVLLFLSPLLTLALATVALLAVGLLSLWYGGVVDVNLERQARRSDFKEEADQLSQAILDSDITPGAFAAQVAQAITSGDAHDQLRLRLAQRMELQRGPIVMEFVYPIAIVGISLMYIYWGDLAPDISEVALYFLLFRQFVMSLNQVGGVFMSFSRHHLALADFTALMQRDELPVAKPVDDEDMIE